MKLGFGVSIWLNQMNVLGLHKALDDCSMLGLDGVEMFWPCIFQEFGDKPKYFKELLDVHGLELSSCYSAIDFDDPWEHEASVRKTKEIFQFAAEAGSKNVLLDQSYMVKGSAHDIRKIPENANDYVLRMAETAEMLANYAKTLGLTTSWHQHWGSTLMVEELLHVFLANTNPELVHFCADTAQLYVSDMDPVEIFRKYVGRMSYIHIKDAAKKVREREQIWEGGPVFPEDDGCYNVNSKAQIIELGRGDIDFVSIKNILKENNFDGWIVDDHDITAYQPYESCKSCIDYLNGALDIWGERQLRRKEGK